MSVASTDGSVDGDGSRVLSIQLPNGKTVDATVDTSMQMMDLLISIASHNGLNPTAYQIAQPSKYKGRPPNVYTPSQSAGDIIGNSIMLVPKKEREQFSINKGKKSGVFEHTVRLTIHSSKNHKMVFRTNPEKRLEEVFPKICEDRGVDPSQYVMRAHKQKFDADHSKTIASFNTLDFDLVEADVENKRKSGLFGKFKKKEDEEEKTEKVKTLPPTSNGSHVKQELGQEQKPQTQTPLDTGTHHKKRPAPRPPPVAQEPNGVEPQVAASDKSAPKMSRVSTKKRRAPPVPGVIVPISIDDPPKEDPTVETPTDETDAPVVSGEGQERDPPSPAASRSSSRDKDSIISGSLGEQESSGLPPSKPPRLNLYSNGIADVDLNSKPVFVPPSPPLTPPSASVPRQDIMKLIAEGRLSVEEDVDGLNNNSENSSISHDRLSAKDGSVEVELSVKDEDGDRGDGFSRDGGDDVSGDDINVTVVKSESVHVERADSVPGNGEGDAGDDLTVNRTSDLQRDVPPADSSSPQSEGHSPSVDNVSRTSVESEKTPTSQEDASVSREDGDGEGRREAVSEEPTAIPGEDSCDNPPPDEVDGGDSPKSQKVCKCIDPENGEECDDSCSPPAVESGKEDGSGSFLPGVSPGEVSEKSKEENDKDESGSGITEVTPVEPTSQSNIKDLTLQVSVDTETVPQGNPDSLPKDKPKPVTSPKPYILPKPFVLPKPKRFVIRQDVPHPLGSRLSLCDENDNESEVAKLRPFDPNQRKSFVFQPVSIESNTEISDDKNKKTSLSLGSELEIPDSDKSISLSQGKDSLPTMSHTMDEESNDTTSYSAVPQEEDFAHQMEEKSLQMTAGAPGLAQEGADDSKSDSAGKVTYQMQTEAVPEEVHDLKEMYQQMQKQLIDLQQTILSQQQQQQQQPANQGAAFQQLQQLQQQQLLLQQTLLTQQGMVPPPMMMMPQTAPMVLQMAPQGVVVPPYMVPPQQQMMVMQQSQSAPAAAQQVQASDGVPGGPRDAQSVENKGEEVTKAGDANLAPGGETQETGEPAMSENANTAGGKESKSASAESQSASKGSLKESETPASMTSPTLPKSSALKEDSKIGSPSSRRKNVFADIIKKKGRPTSNYVLSAQREMLNRQRSNSDAKTSPSQANTRSKVESDISSKDNEDTSPEVKKDISESDKQVAVGAKSSGETEIDSTKSSHADEMEKRDTSSLSIGKVSGVLASSGEMNSTDGSQTKSQPANIVKESEAKDEQVRSSLSPSVKESGDKAKEVHAPPAVIVKETETKDKQELLPPRVNSSEEKETSNQLNEQPASLPSKDNTVVMETKTETSVKSSPSEENNVKVTSFEAQFAEKPSSTVQQGGGDATAHAPPKVAPKPARKPVGKPPIPEASRPFRRSSRPVTLASDRQSELQQMASLSNVSRFKEMMEALKSKETTD